MYTFDLRYPQRKKNRTDLNLVNGRANRCHHAMRSNDETFFQTKIEYAPRYGQGLVSTDGATAHTSRRAMGILRKMFPGHLISLRGDIGWPARSPDLNPCDFILWGYIPQVKGIH